MVGFCSSKFESFCVLSTKFCICLILYSTEPVGESRRKTNKPLQAIKKVEPEIDAKLIHFLCSTVKEDADSSATFNVVLNVYTNCLTRHQ